MRSRRTALAASVPISAHTSSSERPSTPAIAATVENAGVATRPDSILRSVSGDKQSALPFGRTRA